MDHPSLYDEDIVTWSEQQVSALRALASRPDLSNALDWENIAEEIGDLGRSHINGVERRLTLVLVHLLKYISAPDAPSLTHWRRETVALQLAAAKAFTPSMRQRIDWSAMWRRAKREAAADLREYGDVLATGLPEASPLEPDYLLNENFDVDAALLIVSRALASRPSNT